MRALAQRRHAVLLGITYTTTRHTQAPQTNPTDTPAHRAMRASRHLRASLALRTIFERLRRCRPHACNAPRKRSSRRPRPTRLVLVLSGRLRGAWSDARSACKRGRHRTLDRPRLREARPHRLAMIGVGADARDLLVSEIADAGNAQLQRDSRPSSDGPPRALAERALAASAT